MPPIVSSCPFLSISFEIDTNFKMWCIASVLSVSTFQDQDGRTHVCFTSVLSVSTFQDKDGRTHLCFTSVLSVSTFHEQGVHRMCSAIVLSVTSFHEHGVQTKSMCFTNTRKQFKK